MRSFPWYKHYPDRFLNGVTGMSAEEIGCYIVVLDLIYDHGGPIPYEPKKIGAIMSAATRKTNRLVQALLKRGKLILAEDTLSNPMADEAIEAQREQAKLHAKNGQKGGKLRAEIERRLRENNDLAKKGLKHRVRVEILDKRISSLEGSALSPSEGRREEKDTKATEAPSESTSALSPLSAVNGHDVGKTPLAATAALLNSRLMRKEIH